MKTQLNLEQLPVSRPSKRLRRISRALSHEVHAVDRLPCDRVLDTQLAPIRSGKAARPRVAASSIQDIGVLLDSFLGDALTLEVHAPIGSMKGLREPHKSFALELEGRSVGWRAWRTACGVCLIGGTLDASRSERLGGAVIYLEWMRADYSIHRNWWCSFKVGEWIAGLGG